MQTTDIIYDQENKQLTQECGDVTRIISASEVKYEEYRDKSGRLHREDGPAVMDYRAYRHRTYYSYTYRSESVFERGNYPVLEWRIDGKLHREDGPAVIWFDDKIYGAKKREEWYINGKLENITGGPTRITYGEKNKILKQEWLDKKGNFHREDGPAFINDHRQNWFRHGKLHRKDGPAEIEQCAETWYLNGRKHRSGDKPAVIQIYDSHVALEWFKHGSSHRPKGKPSFISFNKCKVTKEMIDSIKDVDDVYAIKGELTHLEYNVDGVYYRKDFENPVKIIGRNIGKQNEKVHAALWMKDGKKHREGGPAQISGDEQEWYKEGERHSVYGPAITKHHPSLNEWYVNGKKLSMKEVRPWMRKNKIDLSTEGGRLAFYLMWGF